MAAQLITNYSDFTPDSIKFAAPRTNARGGKAIKIMGTKNTLIINTPLILTWGINEMVDDKDDTRVSYSLSIQMPDEKYGNPDTRAFYKKMAEFQEKILDSAVENSVSWFGKQHGREVVEALFKPILKHPKHKTTGLPDTTRAPNMKVKIPYWEGKFNIELYDTERRQLFNPEMQMEKSDFINLIPKTSHIAAVLQCNGIWFIGGNFGVVWQLSQAIVRKPVRIQGGCFVTLSATDNQAISDVEKRETEAAECNQDDTGEGEVDTTKVEDSGGEDGDDGEDGADGEAEAEAEPEPVKPKRQIKKKAVVKKTT